MTGRQCSEQVHYSEIKEAKLALPKNQEPASLVDIEHREDLEKGARVNGAFQNNDDEWNQLTDLQDDMSAKSSEEGDKASRESSQDQELPNKEGSEANDDWQCETLERTECNNDKLLYLSEESSSQGCSKLRVEPTVLFRLELPSSSFNGGNGSIHETNDMLGHNNIQQQQEPMQVQQQQHHTQQQQIQQQPVVAPMPVEAPSFNFLQESQIDLESPHMDPAVVMVHHGQRPPVAAHPPGMAVGGVDYNRQMHIQQQHALMAAHHQQQAVPGAPAVTNSGSGDSAVSVDTISEMVDLQDLDITMPMPIQRDCPEIPRPPRTSTPIAEDRAEPNFSNASIIREHSYHSSSHRITGTLRNRQCPLSSFMKQTWSDTRVAKNPLLKKTSSKSKKIVKRTNPKRKFFTKQQLSIATNILYSSKRVYRMLRNQKLMDLPCIRTVYKHLERFKCPPGMNSEMKRLLTIFLLSLDHQDRICGVLFDEMKLAQLMSWSPRLKTVFKPHKVKS